MPCVSTRPSDDAAAVETSDDDATIQHNPNYTEPVQEAGESENVMETVAEPVSDVKKSRKKRDAESEKNKDNELKVETSVEDTTKETEASKGEANIVKISENNGVEVGTIDDLAEESRGEIESVDEGEGHSSDDDKFFDFDEYDEEDEAEEEAVKSSVKSVLDQALSKSRGAPRHALKFIKKNRVKLTIAATLFAFRKEIGRIAYLVLTKPKTVDPETGEVLSRTINISPTSVLKIILFLDLMRKLNSGEVSEETGPLGSKGSILFKLLHQANTAFVPPIEQHWTFERVNERYDKDKMAFQKAMGSTGSIGTEKKPMAQSFRSFSISNILGNKEQDEKEDLVILLDWTKLTESIDQMSSLRDQVSFLLSQHREKNKNSNSTGINATNTIEVIVMLESPGGAAADYGLAAQMMLRLSHEPGLVVTVCVDKVAASGGYMIACASSPGRLYAAPFSVLGSIGVVGSAINVHNVLEGWGVKPLVFRAGKNKAPVGLIGEVTKSGIQQVQNMVDATHVAFKRHVVAARPVLADNINKIATGQVWLGYEALKVGLVDRIITSDEYLGERILQGARVLRLIEYKRPRFLFPPHPSRLSLFHPMTLIRNAMRAVVVEFAQMVQQPDASRMPLVATDHRLTTAATSLGSSMQQFESSKRVTYNII
jgi:serine protease SohB